MPPPFPLSLSMLLGQQSSADYWRIFPNPSILLSLVSIAKNSQQFQEVLAPPLCLATYSLGVLPEIQILPQSLCPSLFLSVGGPLPWFS